MAGRKKSDGRNQSVAHALTILNLLARRSEPLSVPEIARQLRLAPSIAQRLLKTLAKGFLEQTGTTLRNVINGPVALNHRPGAQAHLHSTAMGKALHSEKCPN
jgi:DNA-binding IclR family transcriptional regulator